MATDQNDRLLSAILAQVTRVADRLDPPEPEPEGQVVVSEPGPPASGEETQQPAPEVRAEPEEKPYAAGGPVPSSGAASGDKPQRTRKRTTRAKPHTPPKGGSGGMSSKDGGK